jgi:heme exporter protein C
MRLSWWKVLCIILLAYTLIGGLLFPVPARFILHESIRNLYFHVPMWFTMIALFFMSLVYAIRYLRHGNLKDDIYSYAYAVTGIWFSILGMITGMEWAQYTWGAAWSNDPKQLTTAICMLIYFAYVVLRGGMKDEEKRAKITAVYNVFAFFLMIPLLFVLPRMVDSLHPGNGGNPGFNAYDLDHRMRMVFWPAVIGWILLGAWMSTLQARFHTAVYMRENNFSSPTKKSSNA